MALVAAVVGPLVAYLGASRKLSGKIGTSEAADLWAESSRIRDDYRSRITELAARIAALEATNDALVSENRDLRKRLEDCERSLPLTRRLDSA